MIDLKDTETIIFDLGEVIIDLDSKRVIDQFQKQSQLLYKLFQFYMIDYS